MHVILRFRVWIRAGLCKAKHAVYFVAHALLRAAPALLPALASHARLSFLAGALA
jgi:hypothetical protein